MKLLSFPIGRIVAPVKDNDWSLSRSLGISLLSLGAVFPAWGQTNGLIAPWNMDDIRIHHRALTSRVHLRGTASAAIRSVRVTFPEEQGEATDPPRIEWVAEGMAWPVVSDATGWRLSESDNLNSNVWTTVDGPFGLTNAMVLFEVPSTNHAAFYKLERPPIR